MNEKQSFSNSIILSVFISQYSIVRKNFSFSCIYFCLIDCYLFEQLHLESITLFYKYIAPVIIYFDAQIVQDLTCILLTCPYYFLSTSFPLAQKDTSVQEGNFLSLLKNIYKNITANIILSGEKLEAFSLGSGTRQDVSFHHILSRLYWNYQLIKQEKKAKN